MTAIKTIDTNTLQNWLQVGKKVFLLDIRPLSERAEWLIPQSIHRNVYDRLKAGDKNALDDLHLDKAIPVVTYCAGGKLSLFAAEILAEKGFDAYSLEGGMKAWNYAWDQVPLQIGNAKVIQIRRLAKGCLSYLIGSDKEAIVIDASLDPSVYAGIAEQNGWEIVYVTDTHIHADYVSRTKELACFTGAKHLMIDAAKLAYDFTPITNDAIIQIGDAKLKVIHTPGHTWESTSFLLDDKFLFTGDTLFTDGIGRPDLKADQEEAELKAATLFDSLKKITALPSDVLIFPAHTAQSIVIGQGIITAKLEQLNQNIAPLSFEKESFVKNILAKLPPTPPNYLTIATINQNGDYSGYQLADLEAGANRCAIQ